jgi:ABC-2 type transport system permease protein
MNSLFSKTLHDKRLFVFGWSLALAFMSFLMIIFYPAFHQEGSLDELVKNLPLALQGLVGDLGNLKEMSTYVGSQLFDIRIPIFISILSIILGLGLTVNEEDKGQMRTLLSTPLSRTRIVLEKWLALGAITFIAVASSATGIYLGLFFIHESIAASTVLRLLGMTWLLCVSLATLVFSVGLASGKRGLTIVVGVIVAIGSFLLTTFARSVDWLQGYEKFSLLHYFPATDIAKNGIHLSDVLVLTTVPFVALLVAWLCFRRRDVS